MLDKNSLAQFPIFDGISTERQKEIAGLCHVHHYRKGEVVFQKDESAKHLYGILEGEIELSLIFKEEIVTRDIDYEESISTRVQIFEKPIIIDRLGPGEIFGWSALVEPEKMTATAIITEDAKVFSIPSTDLRKVFERDPELGYIFMTRLSAIISRRLGTRTERLVNTWGGAFDTPTISSDI